MINKLKPFAFLCFLFSFHCYSSQINVNIKNIKITPENISSSGICIEITEFDSPDLEVTISAPPTDLGEEFRSFIIYTSTDEGEILAIESSPKLIGKNHKIHVDSTKNHPNKGIGKLKIEIVYGNFPPGIFVQTIKLNDFLWDKETGNKKTRRGKFHYNC